MRAANIRVMLGIKGIIAIASLLIIVAATITYTATVTITVSTQLTQGKTTQAWTVSPNDVDQVRYLPGVGVGGNATPTFSASDSDTWAFKVVTDANKVCAVKIELTAAVNNTKYLKFEITVLSWSGSAWAVVTLYAGATGGTTKSFIDGRTTPIDSGYVHQGFLTTAYYLIKVTYSYDVTDAADNVVFKYTPLPQDSF